MDLISWILLIVAVGLVAALMWAVKRSGEAGEAARELEGVAASQKSDLAEARGAASAVRRELEELRKDYRSAQDELKEAKRRAFLAEKSQQEGGSADMEAAMIRLRRERDVAVAKCKADTERLTTANEQLGREVEQLKRQATQAAAGAGREQQVREVTGGEGDRELAKLRTGKQKAIEKRDVLESKLARMTDQLDRVRKESNEMRGQIREKDGELLSLRKRTVTAERSYVLLEREHELVATRLAQLEGKSLTDYSVTPVGEPLGRDVARSADERPGGGGGGRGGRRARQRDQGGETTESAVADASAEGGDDGGDGESLST